MAKKPKMEERVSEMERRLDLYEAILDIDPGVHNRCRGNPTECGEDCLEKTCPLQNNRVHDLGVAVLTMYEEFRWQKAWADEMEHLRVVPVGTLERVALRVRKSQLQDKLLKLREGLAEPSVVGTLRDKLVEHEADVVREIEAIDGRLGG
jgi:hypothetical protein